MNRLEPTITSTLSSSSELYSYITTPFSNAYHFLINYISLGQLLLAVVFIIIFAHADKMEKLRIEEKEKMRLGDNYKKPDKKKTSVFKLWKFWDF